MKKVVCLLALLGACAKAKSHQTDAVPASFETKYATYLAQTQSFPAADCDWLLFEALTDAARGLHGLVEQAEGTAGQWFRNPSHRCLSDQRSTSDISRDMLLGAAFYFWQGGDTQNLEEILDYADAHAGVMGEGPKSKTLMTPALYVTLTALVARSGRVPLPPKVEDPDINAAALAEPPQVTGFQAHLLVLHIYLRGLVYGELSALETTLLAAQTSRQPRNAFFQAVYHKFLDGQQDLALAVLMDESLFPASHPPTSENYCEPYLWQRDVGKDWEPCAGALAHTGGDWLFAATIVRNGFRESHE